MLRLAFDFIITWRETRTRPNAYEFCFSFYASKPYVKQMLPLVFSAGCFFQPYMLANNKPVILKIDEFALMFFFMWYASCENSNAWVCSYTVKGILVERNNTF